MRTILFSFASEKILVIIEGEKISFATTHFGPVQTTIDGLKLDYKGVMKEFPELEGNGEWRSITIKRFKDKINNLKTEEERAKYIIEDLKKFGYIPEQMQKGGFRPEKIK